MAKRRGSAGQRAAAALAGLLAGTAMAQSQPRPQAPPRPRPAVRPAPPPQLPDRIDTGVLARLREEAFARSKVLETARAFCDLHGPRLTGSPALRQAQLYARDRLQEWGLANVHLEPWGPFGRGWSLEGFTANLTAPVFAPLPALPKAWSPSTAGVLRGEPVLFDPRTPAELERFRGRLKGRIVLFSGLPPRRQEGGPARRLGEADLQRLEAPAALSAAAPAAAPAADLGELKWRMLYGEGPAVVLEPGPAQPGALKAVAAVALPIQGQPAALRLQPWEPKKAPVLPQLAVAAEPYSRLVRLAAAGQPLKLEVQVVARFHDDDPMAANVLAEIPGGDLKDELVMLGARLDSWHAGTGAVEHAAAAAVAMEVGRILVASGLRPRRTVRIALWSGGEQGSLGSQAYVAAHFGRTVIGPDGVGRFQPGPDHARLSGYLHLHGAGRLRGLGLQGQELLRPVFKAWLAPLADLGAGTVAGADLGAADHLSFDAAGLPGFRFLGDLPEGPGRTSLDLFERLAEDDLKQAAAVAACVVHLLANRDQKLPRKLPPGG